ncbi:MAG: HlyD family type I secretion periplasmic adaptor subunit [Azoarcus sp.]|jgi:protease secretion system membrane fusion protein|nr:HlyD family type I secretion periplasmic adaptor subunit [Azoarcus sp.]
MSHAVTRRKKKESSVVPEEQSTSARSVRRSASTALVPSKAVNALVKALTPKPVVIPKSREEIELPTDTRSPARLGFWVLLIGFGGFLLWAALAPLDEGVPTSGVVAIDTKRKAVQHLNGGIVKAVYVKEGQIVREGDPIVEIDSAVAQANMESARQSYYTLRATEARLIAEQLDRDTISFHDDLLKEKDSQQVADIIANQEGLFKSRRMAFNAEIQALEASVAGIEASIVGNQGLLDARRQQLAALKEEMQNIEELVKDGFAPRNNLLSLQRSNAEIVGIIAELQGNIQRSKNTLAETNLRIAQRRQEFKKEIDRELADVRGKVDGERDRFSAQRNELARTVIRAPASGQVVGLVAQTVGGVIGAGQKIMDIVPDPEKEVLLLETQVPPHLIDRVHAGLGADVRFSNFAHTPSLVVPGKVESISHDQLVDERTGSPYFLARISVSKEGMKKLGEHKLQLQPGMRVEVVIITGERTMLTYLLHPLLKRIAFSLKEE